MDPDALADIGALPGLTSIEEAVYWQTEDGNILHKLRNCRGAVMIKSTPQHKVECKLKKGYEYCRFCCPLAKMIIMDDEEKDGSIADQARDYAKKMKVFYDSGKFWTSKHGNNVHRLPECGQSKKMEEHAAMPKCGKPCKSCWEWNAKRIENKFKDADWYRKSGQAVVKAKAQAVKREKKRKADNSGEDSADEEGKAAEQIIAERKDKLKKRQKVANDERTKRRQEDDDVRAKDNAYKKEWRDGKLAEDRDRHRAKEKKHEHKFDISDNGKATRKAWVKAHRALVNARYVRYEKAHPERIAARRQAYESLPHVKERHAQWKLDHPESVAAMAKKYRLANLEQCREWSRAACARWYKHGKGKAWHRDYRRTARGKLGNLLAKDRMMQKALPDGDPLREEKLVDIDDEQAKQLTERMALPCTYCDEVPAEGHCNSLDRLDNNRFHTLDNCVPSCFICNWMKKHWSSVDFIQASVNSACHYGELKELQPLIRYEFDIDYCGETFREYVSRVAELNRERASKNKSPIKFTIEQAEFESLVGRNCNYCNRPSSAEHRNGLDRLIAGGDYVLDNVVPCCSICNYMLNNFEKTVIKAKWQRIALKCARMSATEADVQEDAEETNIGGSSDASESGDEMSD